MANPLKRLKWGRSRRRPYAYQVHLHAYEDTVIEAKLRQLHSRSAVGLIYYTAHMLDAEFPGLFHIPLLKKALARMHSGGTLARSRGRRSPFSRTQAYAVREEVHRRAGKAA